MATTPFMGPETTIFLASHGYGVRGMTIANTIYIDQSGSSRLENSPEKMR